MDAVFRLLSAPNAGNIAKLTFDRVARAAGVSKGLVTYYFPSKDELLIATIRHYHEQQHQMLSALVLIDAPAEALLPRLVEAAFLSRESVEAELRFQVEVWSFAKDRPDALEAVAESYRAFRSACEALLHRGVEEGYVTAIDRDWAYLFMHALVDGLSFQLALDPDLDVGELQRRTTLLFERLLQGAADA